MISYGVEISIAGGLRKMVRVPNLIIRERFYIEALPSALTLCDSHFASHSSRLIMSHSIKSIS